MSDVAKCYRIILFTSTFYSLHKKLKSRYVVVSTLSDLSETKVREAIRLENPRLVTSSSSSKTYILVSWPTFCSSLHTFNHTRQSPIYYKHFTSHSSSFLAS
jgi:hypothetical protein